MVFNGEIYNHVELRAELERAGEKFTGKSDTEVILAAYRAFHLEAAAFYVVQVGLCSLVMLLPTFLMGMTFPLAVRALRAASCRAWPSRSPHRNPTRSSPRRCAPASRAPPSTAR